MLYLVNPGGSRAERRRQVKATRKAAKRRRKPTAAQLKAREAFARMARGQSKARRPSASIGSARRSGGKMAAKRKRRRKVTAKARPRRKRRSARRTRTAVSLSRRGRVVYRSNPRKRRRYRRNPGFSGAGILGTLTRAGKDALGVVAGMAGTNLIARRIPFGEGNLAAETAKKLLVALGLGMVVRRVAGSSMAEKVIIGGVVAAAGDVLKAVPVVGDALAGGDSLSSWAPAGALPTGGGMGIYEVQQVPDSGRGYR